MATTNLVFLGIPGSVVAFDRASGARVWQTHLKRRDFVNVFHDADLLFAHTAGELFCLDPASGRILWHDELQGLGYGMVTFASPNGPNQNQIAAVIAEMARQQQATASTSATIPMSAGAG